MQMKKSEVFDRWTILLMKARYSDTPKYELAQYNEEVKTIFSSVIGICGPLRGDWFGGLMLPVMRLGEANAKTWEQEAAIRAENKSDPSAQGKPLDLEEIGRRALLIRGHNKVRVESKWAIDEFFGELPDIKVDHASGGSGQ